MSNPPTEVKSEYAGEPASANTADDVKSLSSVKAEETEILHKPITEATAGVKKEEEKTAVVTETTSASTSYINSNSGEDDDDDEKSIKSEGADEEDALFTTLEQNEEEEEAANPHNQSSDVKVAPKLLQSALAQGQVTMDDSSNSEKNDEKNVIEEEKKGEESTADAPPDQIVHQRVRTKFRIVPMPPRLHSL